MTHRLAHVTRREFLQKSGMLVAGLSTRGLAASQANPRRAGIIARPMLDVGTLARFVDPLPVPGAEADKPNVRAVTHLRGAKAPAKSDGYPEAWWVPGKSALYYYPNHQDATMLWYHDHALGITR